MVGLLHPAEVIQAPRGPLEVASIPDEGPAGAGAPRPVVAVQEATEAQVVVQGSRPVDRVAAALASRPVALVEGFRVARPGVRPGARPVVHPEEEQEDLLVGPVGAVPMGLEGQVGTLGEAQVAPDTLAGGQVVLGTQAVEAQGGLDTLVGGGPLAAPEVMGAIRTLSWTGS